MTDAPELYGDGIHDDTDAVQWYLDRRLECRCSGTGYRVDLTRLRFPPGMALVRLPASEEASRTSDKCPENRCAE